MGKMGEREKLAQKLGGSESHGKVGVLKTGLGKGEERELRKVSKR